MSAATSHRSGRRLPVSSSRLAGVLAVIAVLAVVVLDTRVLSPEDVARLNPPAFDPETYGRETFPRVAERLQADATDVTELARAVDADLPAAARQLGGVDLGGGNFAFPISATGTVESTDDGFALLDVDGVPRGTEVRIPLGGAALNGTPVRDASGIVFGDFTDQTDYQSAANQFKLRMQEDVLGATDPSRLRDATVTVSGAWSSGGPPGSFIIQPTTLEVGG